MKSPRSFPAENVPGTPAISTQRIGDDPLADSIASAIASYIAEVSAFFFSGRFMRIVRTGPSSVTMTCSIMEVSPEYSVVIPGEAPKDLAALAGTTVEH